MSYNNKTIGLPSKARGTAPDGTRAISGTELLRLISDIIANEVQKAVARECEQIKLSQAEEKSPELDEEVTIAQVCQAWQITPASLHRWMREGRVPYRKVGRLTRFRLRDINELAESGALGKYRRTDK